jgi:calcineurin-like phosphoesterase family protein
MNYNEKLTEIKQRLNKNKIIISQNHDPVLVILAQE